ncbi:MAG: hypothetical protein OEX15_01370, partial [Gammaproteobacteria bacterium]|nr:hypothetical protein [Gammaproteobacteria bacterium]
FQSVIFGCAYGTGREIAQFISSRGPVGGLLAVAVAALGFALVMALSFELARLTRHYDYRGFLKTLVGPGWIAFEALFLLSLFVVLAVNGSAAASILNDQFGIPALVGVALLFASVVALNYFGRALLQESMSLCMIALTIVLTIFSVMTFIDYHESIRLAFRDAPTTGNWFASGGQWMLYSAAVVPVLLYSAKDLHTRGECFVSAFASGIAGAFPALVFHMTFMAAYPESLEQTLPTYWMIGKLQHPWLMVLYIIVLFAMIIQTCAGLLQGVNERLDAWQLERRGRKCDPKTHAVVGGVTLALSMILASFGIAALVAQGYGNMAWGYMVIYMIPLVTVGAYKIWRKTGTAGLS